MSEIRVDRIKNHHSGSGAVELTEGATIPTGKSISGAGDINITGTLTYEDVTNVDSVGIVTARGGLKVGTSGAGATITSVGDAEFAGLTTARFGGVTETVSVGSTTLLSGGSGKDVILELDCSKGTVFSHDLDTGGPVGIVSIKNFRVNTNTFTTATVIFTQHSWHPSGGVGNTMVASVPGGFPGGIGTEVTLGLLWVLQQTLVLQLMQESELQLRSHFQQLVVMLTWLHLVFTTTVVEQEPQETIERTFTKSGDFRFGSIGF